jgi:hypothetical protein
MKVEYYIIKVLGVKHKLTKNEKFQKNGVRHQRMVYRENRKTS